MSKNVFFKQPPTNYPLYFENKIQEAYECYKSRSHPDIDALINNPRLLLDSYCDKFFRAKPTHKLQRKRVRYHLIISADDKLIEGDLFQHEIKIFDFILASEPTLKEENAELASISTAFKLLCEELCDRITGYSNTSFDIDDYHIVDEIEPERFNESRYLKQNIPTPLQQIEYIKQPSKNIQPIGREMFVNAYKVLCNSKEKDSLLYNPVLTFFNKFMAGFVKVPLKFLFYVPTVCNDISSVQDDLKNENLILVKPDLEFESNSKLTYALLAINQDMSQLINFNKSPTDQIKYISLGHNISKQKAKIDAVLKFFKHIDNGLYERFVSQKPTEHGLNLKTKTLEASNEPNAETLESPTTFCLDQYKKFKIQEPLLITGKTRCFELNPKHKTPKGLLQEFFAKKFRSKLEDFITFEITRGINTPHQIVLKYQSSAFSTEANTVKEGQEILSQRFLTIIYPLYTTYFALLNDITTNKKELIPEPHMESFRVNFINKITRKLKEKIKFYKECTDKRLIDMDSDLVVNEEYPEVSYYKTTNPIHFE